ncbi:hypothetical protein QVD17_38611 [Tagetes erecta]|uniref:Uncharacterized protein n=1 Tax=Tagetes erecta TaxID=13708 RepID=A0AAD8JNS7_TARER|nr:hypothetical protein QVD17_38611 [Tagetes erecta]
MNGTIPSCLRNLYDSLLVLNLQQNSFHGPVKSICMYGSPLKAIDLSENQFVGPVSKSFINCTSLEFLSLAKNYFEDVFPVWLGTLPKLQVLNLKSNKLYGSIKGLSTNSSQFLMLRIIDISNNNFSGQLPDKLFQSWNAMKYAFNDKSSAMGYMINIPQSLKDLYGLESLNISNNHFTGQISSSLGNLKNLESLDLSQNELSGQIPQQLLQLGFLAIFNVSFNHLHGRIPQGEQFNTFENNSYLGNNGLCGKPLSDECKDSKVSLVVPPTSNDKYESLKPIDRIDWMVISIGLGSGLVIGIVIGNFVYASYYELEETFKSSSCLALYYPATRNYI